MGFFTTKEVQSISRPAGKLLSCASCGLALTRFKKIEPTGNFEKKILIITDEIEPEDAARGKPFQGRAGKYFTKELKSVGIDLWKDCLSMSLVKCPPTDDDGVLRQPTERESRSCCRKIQKLIRQMHPRIIVLVGNLSATALLSLRWTKGIGGIEKWRGWAIPDQGMLSYLCPVYSPTMILEKLERAPEYQTIWRLDLKRIGELNTSTAPFPQLPPYEDVVSILSPREAVTVLESLLERKFPSWVAIDYETTGLKPHNTEDHQIVCTSLCVDEARSFVFDLESKRVRNLWKELLVSPLIGKVAQNMKYEHTWSKNILGVDVENWIWDTMLATHLLDNRPDITGLKFQTYVQFGEAGYDDEIGPYLRSGDDKNSNAVNRIREAVNNKELRKKLFTYCALDSWFTYKLAKLQMGVIR